jgi:hypothetical protein
MNSSTSSFKRVIGILMMMLSWILVLWMLRIGIYHGIRKNTIGEYNKMNHLFVDTIYSNTIFLGSSRCESHIIPGIIDSITGLSSYNCGLGGADLPINAMTLQSILSRSNHVKHVVWSIDIHNMNGKNDVNSLSRFLPYLHDPAVYAGLKKLDRRTWYFKYVPFYSIPFMGDKLLYTSYRGYKNQPTAFDLSYEDGFVPVPAVKNGGFLLDVTKPFYAIPTTHDEEAMKEIIDICKSKNIQLTIILVPLHTTSGNNFTNKKQMIQWLERQIENTHIKYVNYMDTPICDSSSLKEMLK